MREFVEASVLGQPSTVARTPAGEPQRRHRAERDCRQQQAEEQLAHQRVQVQQRRGVGGRQVAGLRIGHQQPQREREPNRNGDQQPGAQFARDQRCHQKHQRQAPQVGAEDFVHRRERPVAEGAPAHAERQRVQQHGRAEQPGGSGEAPIQPAAHRRGRHSRCGSGARRAARGGDDGYCARPGRERHHHQRGDADIGGKGRPEQAGLRHHAPVAAQQRPGAPRPRPG